MALDNTETAHIIGKLNGLKAHVKELQDHIKKLEASLPATLIKAIVEGLDDPKTLKLMTKL